MKSSMTGSNKVQYKVVAVTMAVASMVCAANAADQGASLFDTVYSFSGADGVNPTLNLLHADDGYFYGATEHGGAYGSGSIFRMSADGALTTLHSFNGADGAGPAGGVIVGPDGAFYGTTEAGGASNSGTVFRITGDGVFTTLHSFSGLDGGDPLAGLTLGSDGTFYGTTYGGGAGEAGTVYKITLEGVETTLYSFSGPDGARPFAGLIEGAQGTFFGTSSIGGAYGYGTIFKISPQGVLTTLYSFGGSPLGGSEAECSNPLAPLTAGSNGDLYGTTAYCFSGTESGSVFKLAANGTLTTLHVFAGADGNTPTPGGLALSADGYLYGVTGLGGSNDQGTMFRVDANGDFDLLHSFTGSGGSNPFGKLAQTADGYFWSTTYTGGDSGNGTIFKILPVPVAPTGLVAKATVSQHVGLKWAPVPGAVSYNLYQGTAPGGEASTPVKANLTTTAASIGKLVTGEAYYFTVAAVNAAGVSKPSGEVSVIAK